MKAIKQIMLGLVIVISMASCVVTARPYGARWVPGHWAPGYYHPHWVRAHWA